MSEERESLQSLRDEVRAAVVDLQGVKEELLRMWAEKADESRAKLQEYIETLKVRQQSYDSQMAAYADLTAKAEERANQDRRTYVLRWRIANVLQIWHFLLSVLLLHWLMTYGYK